MFGWHLLSTALLLLQSCSTQICDIAYYVVRSKQSYSGCLCAAAVLRDVRLSKQLNLLRTAQHLLLANQWVALEGKLLALAR